jgi:hypothetical protein
MKLAFATRARATRVFLPVALAGVLSTTDPDPVFTTRLSLLGCNRKRLALQTTSNERLSMRGTSGKRLAQVGASR